MTLLPVLQQQQLRTTMTTRRTLIASCCNRIVFFPPLVRRCLSSGSRGSRGHGWLSKYRAGLGGRHLQGDYFDQMSWDEKNQWNNHIFSLSSSFPTNKNNNNEIDHHLEEAPVAPARVFLDVQVQTGKAQNAQEQEHHESQSSESSSWTRLTVELATFAAPVASQNFTLLCQDQLFVHTKVDRIEKDAGWVMGSMNRRLQETNGLKSSQYNSKKERLWGHCHPSLSDTDRLYHNDTLALWHMPGIVTMLSPNVHEIDSRFVICTHMAPQLDGRHVPFGRLTPESLQFVQDTSSVFTKRGVPTVDIVVMNSGVLLNGGDGDGMDDDDDDLKTATIPKEQDTDQEKAASA